MKKLDISKDEKKSISVFLGDRQASIKMLTNFDPINYVKLYNDGVLLYGSPDNPNELANGKERFREDIDNFVNIYSAMYKDMLQRRINGNENEITVYRYDSKENSKDIGKNRRILSTSFDKKEAFKNAINKGVCIKYDVRSDVPYIHFSNDNFTDAKDDEVFIAPFTFINKMELLSTDTPILSYESDIKKHELADISKDDITNNRRAVTNGFERNIKNMFEYDSLENKKSEKATELFDKMIVYKGKLLSMLEGMCKEKEKELEEKYSELKSEKDMQTKKQAFDTYRRVRNQSLEIIANIYNDTYGLYASLNDDDKKLEDKAASYGVSYEDKIDTNSSNEIIKNIFENYKHFKTNVEELNITMNSDPRETINAELLLRPRLKSLTSLYAEKSEEFSHIKSLHNKNGNKKINKNLYNKVFKIMQEDKIKKIKEEKHKVEEEKVGFFGRLFGKEKLRRERIKNLELQQELEEKRKPEERQDYSIIDTLSDMHANALVNNPSERVNELLNQNNNKITEEVLLELQKSFNPELKKICDQVAYNEKDFDLIEISETTAQASNAYYKANLPMPVGEKKLKTKEEIEYFRQINGYLQTEINKISNPNEGIRNNFNQESTNDVYLKTLRDIEKQTKKLFLDNDENDKELENETIIKNDEKDIDEK